MARPELTLREFTMSGSDGRSDEPIDVLLVEDNPGDVRLTREAFETTDRETRLHVADAGEEALRFLDDEEADESLPDLVLLDLGLPGKDGRDVLEAIRERSRLQRLPVLVFTNSEASDDVAECYGDYANAYLTKPTGREEFVAMVETIERFWFERAQLPPVPQ